MTNEQIEELKAAVAAARNSCDEIDALLSDYAKCENDISRKYLEAAIKKRAATITTQPQKPQ